MSYKARIFTREEFGNVIAAAIYDYDHAPAKILYPIDVIIDQLYDHYGTEPRWRNETTSV
jgi:hypothetical protein